MQTGLLPPHLLDRLGEHFPVGIEVRGEELLANWFGWANRTLESTAEPADVPWLWRRYAFHGYLALQRVDDARGGLAVELSVHQFRDLVVHHGAPTNACPCWFPATA